MAKNIKIRKICSLGDSNNPNQRKHNPLIDYKKMTHNQILDEIKQLFSLDVFSKEK